MAPTTLRTVAQTKVAQSTQAKTASNVSKTAPKQFSRLAALLSSNAVAAKMALADETFALPEVSIPQVDVPDASGIADLFTDNPILVGGLGLLVAVPLGLNAILNIANGGGSGVKPTSVPRTLQALEEDSRVVLVDIRSKAEIKEEGTPDLRSVKRTSLSLPFTAMSKGGEITIDDEFGEKFARLRGISEESLVILLDSDGSIAKKAASQIDDVAKIYYVQGGAAAWAESGPWRQPSAGLSLALPDLKAVGASINNLAEDFKTAPSFTKAGLAAGAILGAGVLVFNEIEVVLELAGLLAAGNFALKFLFADEREKTMTEIKTLVDEKVALQDVGKDLGKIAKAVLEENPVEGGAAAAAAAAAPATSPAQAATPAAAPVAAAESGNGAELENVKEAKEWIDNWKAKAT